MPSLSLLAMLLLMLPKMQLAPFVQPLVQGLVWDLVPGPFYWGPA